MPDLIQRLCRVALLTGSLWLLGTPAARADSCTASMTDIVFTGVSPISGSDYYANGTLTVTCTWTVLTGIPPLLLFPNVAVCVNLGPGSGGGTGNPRVMSNGTGQLRYNLYTDNSYAAASVWGGSTLPGSATPVSLTMGGLLALGSVSRTFTIYGKVPGNTLAGVATAGNADTLYSASFSGHGTVNYAFYGLIPASCDAGASAAFSFQAKATVVNNCVINTGNLAFGTNSVLKGALRANAAMTVLCTANNAYQIALNGGTSGNGVAARKMRNAATGETVDYRISSTLDGPVWGDGSAGTALATGTGTGLLQTINLHGLVPAQTTPSPGDYKDTVTATLYF
jgi:spore coat protein U-like protein